MTSPSRGRWLAGALVGLLICATAALLIVRSGWYGTGEDEASPGFDRPPHPTADGLAACPFGHTDLVDVPIDRGQIWSDELEQRVARLEVWYAPSSLLGADAPETAVVCRDCRYGTESTTWRKAASTPLEFHREPTSLLWEVHLLDVPGAISGPWYVQSVTQGGDLDWESIAYSSAGTARPTLEEVLESVERGGGVIEGEPPAPHATRVEVEGRAGDVGFELEYSVDPDDMVRVFLRIAP